MPSRFYIHVLDEDQDYVRLHDVAITDHLTTQLLLLLQSMRAADITKQKINNHGISGDASVESYDKAEAIRLAHEAMFPNADEEKARIQASTRANHMIPQREL